MKWNACFLFLLSCSYLLILDRTNWKSNILTALLIPYIFFSLPDVLFNLLRGEVGKWIAIIAVIVRLFFPRRFPDWLELPAALILVIVVAPSFFADSAIGDWVGIIICLIIACYLLQEHIRASGGFRNSFTKTHGISNTVGIILLLVYPVWAFIIKLLWELFVFPVCTSWVDYSLMRVFDTFKSCIEDLVVSVPNHLEQIFSMCIILCIAFFSLARHQLDTVSFGYVIELFV